MVSLCDLLAFSSLPFVNSFIGVVQIRSLPGGGGGGAL